MKLPSEHRATATRLNLSETKLIASASRLNKDESRLTEDYCWQTFFKRLQNGCFSVAIDLYTDEICLLFKLLSVNFQSTFSRLSDGFQPPSMPKFKMHIFGIIANNRKPTAFLAESRLIVDWLTLFQIVQKFAHRWCCSQVIKVQLSHRKMKKNCQISRFFASWFMYNNQIRKITTYYEYILLGKYKNVMYRYSQQKSWQAVFNYENLLIQWTWKFSQDCLSIKL